MNGTPIDDNLLFAPTGFACRQCGHRLGGPDEPDLPMAVVRTDDALAAGPVMHAAPSAYTDRQVILRQIICPGCAVAFRTEVVLAEEPLDCRLTMVRIPQDSD